MTLTETVVVIAVSVFALLALVTLFLTFNSTYGYEEAFVVVVAGTSAAGKALEAAIVPADLVLASRTIAGTPYASATTTLVLETPAIDSTGARIAGAYDYIVFYLSGSTLYRLIDATSTSARTSGTAALTSILSSIAFTYDSADRTKVTNVSTDVVSNVGYKGQTVASHVAGRWYLRNRITP